MNAHRQHQQDAQFVAHQNLVYAMAWRMHCRSRRYVQIDDLIAYGHIGLIQAIQSYDASRNVRFTTFAWYRVRGAILDGMRQMSWFNEQDYEDGKYESANTSDKSGVGKAKELRGGNRTGQDQCDSQGRSSIRGHVWNGCISEVPSHNQSGEEVCLHRELLSFLRDLIGVLPEREASLIKGTFFEGQTLTEAAKRIGISTAWASRLQARTLADLRVILEQNGFVPNA